MNPEFERMLVKLERDAWKLGWILGLCIVFVAVLTVFIVAQEGM